MARGGVKGGKNFRRKIAELQRRGKLLASTVATVGFHDQHIAQFAALHEFGGKARDGSRLPERPAFRAAYPVMADAMRDAIEADAKGKGGLPDRGAIEAGARDARDALRRSYEHAPGPPVGERQAARKAGTPGAGRLLIGSEGPKLPGHIEAEIDGRKVD